MNRFPSPLDVRVSSAMIAVCEDLTLDIEQTAQEICDEFADSETPASLSAIVSDLRSARLVQIQENQYSDRLYVEAP